MRKRALLAFALIGGFVPVMASASGWWSSFKVQPRAGKLFGVLPEGVRFPEGIAVHPDTGDVTVGTFDFGPNNNQLVRFDRRGRVRAQKDMGATPLLGLAFSPDDDKIYFANFGLSQIQRIDSDFDAGTSVETVASLPSIGAPGPRMEGNPDGTQDTIMFGNGFPAPNAMVFSEDGDMYVSDSFQGAIFRVDAPVTCTDCSIETVVHDPLLATAGFPPFGANGLVLSPGGESLFVANTGDDRVLKVELDTGTVSVFAESVNGADGMAMDAQGRLWVAANQADQLVALNSEGMVVAEIGEFLGIAPNGTPIGLSFPASVAIEGKRAWVTNFAIPLTPNIGDEPEEHVFRYTVTEFKLPH